MITGIRKVSYVDWCLTSRIAPSLSPCGRFSMPVTWARMPRTTRAPLMHSDSQARAMRYRGTPRTPSSVPSMMASA